VANDRPSRKPKRAEPTREQRAYVALVSTADRVRGSYQSLYAPYDITHQQYNVLRILRGAEPDGLPTLTIADRMIERTPGVTRILDRLVAKGLVERTVPPNDRRCVRCRITRRGLDVLAALDEPVAHANREAFRGLDAGEIDELSRLLEKTRAAHEPK